MNNVVSYFIAFLVFTFFHMLGFSLNDAQSYTISIDNARGELVMQNLNTLLNEEIDISQLKKGPYLLTLKNSAYCKGIKFIKE